MSTEQEQISATIAGLEAQRARLGDAVIDAALAPLRDRLAALGAAGSMAAQALRQVTVLFMDVVGSTTLSRQLDPEDIHAVMDGLLARCTADIETEGGRVLQYAGDSLLAVFGAPASREDDAERAVQAGLRLLAQGGREGDAVRRRFGHAGFGVRVGVHTGRVLLGGGVDGGGTIRGIAVNVAARMEQTAPPGALRISEDTYRQVRGLFDVERQEPLAVKGLAEPVASYLVLRQRPVSQRRRLRGIEGIDAPLIGRDAELRQLQQAFDAVARERCPRRVLLVGEAGLGKTRLIDEFIAWADARAGGFGSLIARAQPGQQAQPFGLLRDLLVAWAQLDAADAGAARQRFSARVAPLLAGGDDADEGVARAHRLGHLIGLDFGDSPHLRGIRDDPPQLRRRALDAAARWLQQLADCDGRPLVLILDDLHWADDGTLDFVEQLARDTPLLLLGSTRPMLRERRPDWWREDHCWTHLPLEPLAPLASRRLASALLHRLASVPDDLREALCGRAEGNPFFLEELVKVLLDQRLITVDDQDLWHLQAGSWPDTVPQTLTGVLQARLDRLPTAQRTALQCAAVIGPEFDDAALAAIDAAAVAQLPALQERGVVVHRHDDDSDRVRAYRFGHQLLQQVAYDGLLRADRQAAHARVADWFATQQGARANDFLGVAAGHYERAGNRARAASLHIGALEHAASLDAHQALLDHAARALALLDAARADGDEVDGADGLRWRALVAQEVTFDRLGRRDAQRAVVDALQALADSSNDDARRAEAQKCLSLYAMRIGDAELQRSAARRAIDLAARVGAVETRLRAQNLLAIAMPGKGCSAEARALAEAGLAEARACGLRRVEGSFLNTLSVLATQEDDFAASIEAARLQWAFFHDTGDRAAEASALLHLGISLLGAGERVRSRAHLEDGLALARSSGDRALEPYALTYLALIAQRDGDLGLARRHAVSAQAIAAEVHSAEAEIVAWCRVGDVELAESAFDAAEAAYRRAEALGRAIDDPLRFDAAAGLARVALARGDTSAAVAAVEEAVTRLAQGDPLDAAESRQLIRLTAYRALDRAGDPRARGLLAAAYAELQDRVRRLPDPALQACLLDDVPEHRAIVAAWQAFDQDTGVRADPRSRSCSAGGCA